MEIFRKYVQELFSLCPGKISINLILMVLLGTVEGIGILMLVPLLHFSGIVPAAELTSASNPGGFLKGIGSGLSLPTVLLIYVGIIVVHSGLHRFQTNLNVQIQQYFHSYLSLRLFQRIAYAQWSCLAAGKKSDVTHMITSELARVTGGTQYFLQLTASAVISLIQVGVAFYLSPFLTLVVIAGGLVFFTLMQTYVRRAKEMGIALSRHNRNLFFTLTEYLNGMKEVKSCAMEELHIARFKSIRNSIAQNFIRFSQVLSSTRMLYKIGAAIMVSIFFYSGVSIFLVQPRELILLIVIFARLWPRITSFQGGLQQVMMMLPAFHNLLDFEEKCLREKEPEGDGSWGMPGDLKTVRDYGIKIKIKQGIQLRNVSYSYHSHGTVDAVRDVSFFIPAGGITVLVGVSGSGKSTVADLITGLIMPREGEVLIDGVPLEKLNLRLWRKSIGYVPQEPFLFHGSILDNLLWANPNATREEIWSALRMASVDNFVASLPQGLYTEVGDRGTGLSGGERQRIVLARALLRNPTLLILDEATGSLDPENERRILNTLESLAGKSLTVLFITHRLSSIKNAHQIIVLDRGKVAQVEGTSMSGQESSPRKAAY
ncbi:MAG: ABC transporter ATP-binding protein [Bacillota bacterium]|nr:ABC transporter ATP-binding protein [Clostridia bacterium]